MYLSNNKNNESNFNADNINNCMIKHKLYSKEKERLRKYSFCNGPIRNYHSLERLKTADPKLTTHGGLIMDPQEPWITIQHTPCPKTPSNTRRGTEEIFGLWDSSILMESSRGNWDHCPQIDLSSFHPFMIYPCCCHIHLHTAPALSLFGIWTTIG